MLGAAPVFLSILDKIGGGSAIEASFIAFALRYLYKLRQKQAMTQHNKGPLRRFFASKTLRVALFLFAILVLSGVFLYLMNDDGRGTITPETLDEAEQGSQKSIYDILDVLGNYLWGDVMKSAKADSATRADREKAQKEKEEAEKARKSLIPSPATDEDVDAVEEMGTQPQQTVPTPNTPPQPATAAPKIDKVASPKVETIGND